MGYEDVVRLAQDREQLECHDSRRSAPDDDDDDDWQGSGRHGKTIQCSRVGRLSYVAITPGNVADQPLCA